MNSTPRWVFALHALRSSRTSYGSVARYTVASHALRSRRSPYVRGLRPTVASHALRSRRSQRLHQLHRSCHSVRPRFIQTLIASAANKSTQRIFLYLEIHRPVLPSFSGTTQLENNFSHPMIDPIKLVNLSILTRHTDLISLALDASKEWYGGVR